MSLKFTGHPFVDVGVATVLAYSGNSEPAHVTQENLKDFAQYLLDFVYYKWKGVFSVVFTNNGYLNPTMGQEKRDRFRKEVFYGFCCKPDERKYGQCVFCGDPAVMRAARHHIPLILGEDTINFYPYGYRGLPVCGYCLFAIQVFPLGSLWCEGRVLTVHADRSDVTYDFAKIFYQKNICMLSLMDQNSNKSEPQEKLSYPRTLLMNAILEVENESQSIELPCSITAYHMTNYGSNADINIYHVPYSLISFLRAVKRAPYNKVWSEIVHRAWGIPNRKKKAKNKSPIQTPTKGEENEGEGAGEKVRNFLYEDLFNLPNNANQFIRIYFLRGAYKSKYGSEDPRRSYSPTQELDLVSWDITQIFLREVLNMEKERIEIIRRLGDEIAKLIEGRNDTRLFKRFWMTKRYDDFRGLLIRADIERTQQGESPLLTFDDFLAVFEYGEEIPLVDWRLARDLLLVRMLEQLHKSGWFRKHQNEIIEAVAQENEEEDLHGSAEKSYLAESPTI